MNTTMNVPIQRAEEPRPATPVAPSAPGVNTSRVLLIAGLIGAVGLIALVAARGSAAGRGRPDPVAGVARYLRGFAGPAAPRPAPGAALSRPVEPRVVILKGERRLYLLDGSRVVAEWDVQLGFDPVGVKLAEGDGRTPEGTYYICMKNSVSRYHRFLGLSYPGIADADRGLRAGTINSEAAEAIRRAVVARSQPPWNTAVGGAIGLHGTGGPPIPGDWTAGCIALSDTAIDGLFRVLEIGDPVEIRP